MEIKILGAHNLESANTRLVSILIDGVLAIDAGSLTSSLSFPEQQQVKAILLTHYHFDHIRDIATIGLNNYSWGTKKLFSIRAVLSALSAYIMNGVIYPDFTQMPSRERPSLELFALEPYKPETIEGYRVLAVPVNHVSPTVGYEVTSEGGKAMFYSGDTAPGLSSCWGHISPQLLIIETTLPDRFERFALESGHLTPGLLKEELAEFRRIKGYIPPVVVIHMMPEFDDEIRGEVNQVGQELETAITLGYEGMRLRV